MGEREGQVIVSIGWVDEGGDVHESSQPTTLSNEELRRAVEEFWLMLEDAEA